jgi:HPt (histidine-containing phosphotransfer) domain-containing protein
MKPDPAPNAPNAPDKAPAKAVALDAVAIARLRELDPDGRHGVVTRVLGAFETSLNRMLVQLASEEHGGDPGVVAGVAHTLKSSSASVGAISLAHACSEVERRVRSGTPGDLRLEVERLLAEGEAALVLVRAMLRP